MAIVKSDIFYFANEGKENLRECAHIAFRAVIQHGFEKLLIFTAKGDGLQAALEIQEQISEYSQIKLVGVTFPQGKLFAEKEGEQPPTQIDDILLGRLKEAQIPIVRARLPFDPIWSTYPTKNVLAQDMSIIGNALNTFGGGMSLCFQAALMACDAGEVQWGEHVVVMSADTALIVQAAPTDHFLTDLIVREILCKPAFLTVSRKEDGGFVTQQGSIQERELVEDIEVLGIADPNPEQT